MSIQCGDREKETTVIDPSGPLWAAPHLLLVSAPGLLKELTWCGDRHLTCVCSGRVGWGGEKTSTRSGESSVRCEEEGQGSMGYGLTVALCISIKMLGENEPLFTSEEDKSKCSPFLVTGDLPAGIVDKLQSWYGGYG